MKFRASLPLLVAFLALPLLAPGVRAQERYIVVSSTTSTENSGLFGHLLPRFSASTGIAVRVVAVGTGQALRLGQRGDADVVFVHGHGIERRDVMYNDFVVIGPAGDPAGIAGGKSVAAALRRVAERRAPFVSRADDSGTHQAELRLWKESAVDPHKDSGQWYKESGAGMGATLNIAAGMDAYTLSDRGTWLSFKNRRALRLLLEGDPRLFNQYGVMLVNPARHPPVKQADGMAFIRWITSPVGQQAIADFKVNGEPLFFPNYRP
jgi:tungstate transport system substrate-binding protein